MSSPYNEYKSFRNWNIVESAVNELKENKDIQITTQTDYVIGFITKKIEDAKSDNHILYKILEDLDEAKIHYKLERYRTDTIMICVTVVGARIEIEVFNSGDIQTSILKGDESIESGSEFVYNIINSNRD